MDDLIMNMSSIMIEPYTLTSENLSVTQKAAMLLIAMGVDNAAQVMKNMSDSEVEKIKDLLPDCNIEY